MVFIGGYSNNLIIIITIVELQAMMLTSYVQLRLFTQIYFGFALLFKGISGDPPIVDIDIGYLNELELKFIWLSRLLYQDQFLFENEVKRIHKNIQSRLELQYDKLNYPKQNFIIPVDTYDCHNISVHSFYHHYVLNGRPLVLKNCSFPARDLWNISYFKDHYGDITVDVLNMSSVSSVSLSMKRFYELTALGEPLYIRTYTSIFDKHPV